MKFKKVVTNIIAIALSLVTLSQSLSQNKVNANGDTSSGVAKVFRRLLLTILSQRYSKKFTAILLAVNFLCISI